MWNPEKIFAHSPEVVFPSNVPVVASEIPGWLLLVHGEIHVFLTARERGEYGRRHFVATLHPGACFPACPFRELPGAPGCEYGYLLVPQTPATCRTVSAEEFSASLGEHPVEGAALFNRLVATLSSAFGGLDAEASCCVDSMTLPETLQEIIRKTRQTIEQRERDEEKNAASERLRQEKQLREKFEALQRIIRPPRPGRSGSVDPLLAAIRIVAGRYHLPLHFVPPDGENTDPESRLIELCRINQWRIRRIQLESGYSRLHHGVLIGFHGEEARPCLVELNGDDSVWYFPGEGEMYPLTPEREMELQDVAYCFYENFPLRPLELRDLACFLFKGCRKFFLCILAVGILVGLFGLVTPVATAYVTGKIIPTANIGELWQLLILLLALTLGTVILNVVPQLCLLLFGSSALERLMAALFDRIFRLPIVFFPEVQCRGSLYAAVLGTQDPGADVSGDFPAVPEFDFRTLQHCRALLLQLEVDSGRNTAGSRLCASAVSPVSEIARAAADDG